MQKTRANVARASPPVIITNLFVYVLLYSNHLFHCCVYYYHAASTRRIRVSNVFAPPSDR